MNGPEDGFPYNSIIREKDLYECKETDIIEYENSNDSNLTVFDFIDEERMNNLNKRQPYIQNFEEIKETDLSDMTEIRETAILDSNEVKETDLCSDDTLEDDDENESETTLVASDQSSSHHDDDGDSGQWHLDNAESVSVSTDSGFINDKMNLDLDFNNLSSSIKFQDLESDFFETDCELMDKSPMDECFETNHGETKEMVRFQDIESDFFETDCEGSSVDSHNEHKVNFQDIESDFFDDEDDISPNTTLKKHPSIKHTTISTTTMRQNNCSELDEQKEILSRLSINQDKRASMTNNLLRSTIEELERALSNSNTLLSKRDQKINDLRKRNTELKKSLSEELENSAQMKLLLLEKEAQISERQATISQLQQEVEKLNKEISELKLYKFNNIEDFSFTCDPENLQNATETDLLGDQDTSLAAQAETQQKQSEGTHSSACKTKCPHSSRTQQIRSPTMSREKSMDKSSPVISPTHSRSASKPADSPKSPGKTNNPDNVSSTELHARLQMKFMRDAFFYYMIGFHSDEQINAILAILNYGDKRQDFVLEAHKLKKMGKKFNVSKVSTRGLTFVQDVDK